MILFLINALTILVQKTLREFQNKMICFHSLTIEKMRFFKEVQSVAISKTHQYSDIIYTITKENTDTFFGFPVLIV